MLETLWHHLTSAQALDRLGVGSGGLIEKEADRRTKRFGSNELPHAQADHWASVLARQLVSPLMVILALAGIVSAWLGDWVDASVIAAAFGVNGMIGFIQEFKAGRALAALRSMLVPHARVLRGGREIQIEARQLVPGDILLLSMGDRVGADARLLDVHDFATDEGALTGESRPVEKQLEPLPPGQVLAERSNMVYAGTSVVAGRARAVVVGTGNQTQMGHIATLVTQTAETPTPLMRELSRFARVLALAVVVLVVVLFIAGVGAGRSTMDMFQISVALAVAAVPEGLTVSVTVILAVGMQRILRRRALTRRLVAAETLGSVSVICTDKTGTITQGAMRVTHLASVDTVFDLFAIDHQRPPALKQMVECMALCNDGTGPTEQALLQVADSLNPDVRELAQHHPRVAEVPFTSATKSMLTAHTWRGGTRVFMKGALSHTLDRCTQVWEGDEAVALTPARRQKILDQETLLTRQGLRLMALYTTTVEGHETPDLSQINAFTFLGFAGMQDPLREGAREHIAAARAAGVRAIIVTGDHPETARAIAVQAGIVDGEGEAVTGAQLDSWSDDELVRRIPHISIFARVEPRHKIRIVQALQARGEVVAMTGDGVNDAPAIKAADIGVALGSGSEVSKQTADLVLTTNDLGTITAAIEEGRVIFDNIRKTTVYLLADSFTEIVLIGGSILMGLPVPLLPAQILWINLVADSFPNIGLAFEPAEHDVMRLPPRPRGEPILNRDMLMLVVLIGLVTDLLLFGLYAWLLGTGERLETIRSLMFAAVGIDSLLYIFAVKSFRRTIFHINPFSNLWLILGVAVGFALMALAMLLPTLQRVLDVSPIALSYVWLLLMMGMVKLVAIEAGKALIFAKGTGNS